MTGLPAYPETVLGTPISYRSDHVGNFFLANKLGAAEFNRDYEETLEMFRLLTEYGLVGW